MDNLRIYARLINNNMEINKTTILGGFITLMVSAIVMLDMSLSVEELYTFDLQWSYVLTGLGIGVGLIILPEDRVKILFEKIIDKFISK